jgi:hypothetical protein
MEDDPSSWPFSDRIYVVAETAREAVAKRLATLGPDDVFEETDLKKRPLTPNAKPQSRVFCAWWD